MRMCHSADITDDVKNASEGQQSQCGCVCVVCMCGVSVCGCVHA